MGSLRFLMKVIIQHYTLNPVLMIKTPLLDGVGFSVPRQDRPPRRLLSHSSCLLLEGLGLWDCRVGS